MSRLRQVLAEMQQAELQLNEAIYKEKTIEKGTFIIKDDVIKDILGELDYDVDFTNTPDEGVGFDFSMNGTSQLGIAVEHSYGQLSEDDKHYIVESLNDSEIAKNFIEDAAYDVSSELRDMHIHPYFTLSGNTVQVEVTAEI